MAKLVIFDFDGTMFHTGPGIHLAVNETLKEMNHRELSYEEVTDCIGGGLFYLLKRLDASFEKSMENLEEMGKLFRKNYEKFFREHSEPYPGLVDFLDNFPYEVAIASNKHEYYIHETLKMEPWNKYKFVKVFGGDSLATKKPDPLMLKKIIKA